MIRSKICVVDLEEIQFASILRLPPCEVTHLKFSVCWEKLEFCNDPRASWVLDSIQSGFKVGFSSEIY